MSDGGHNAPAHGATFAHPRSDTSVGRTTGLLRIINSIGALCLLVALAPLVLVIALGLRLRQGPGVLTRERRLGQHAVVFWQWAFRFEDQRGRALPVSPASGLQNLPALLNVLTGDMVIFGPRPVSPVAARQNAAHDPLYTTRFAVKPGLLALDS